MALRHRGDARAHDLDRVRAEVERHRENGRRVFAEMHAQARQAEEHEEQLHDERRVADRFDIAATSAAQPRVLAAAARRTGTPTATPSAVETAVSPSVDAAPLANMPAYSPRSPKLKFIGH